MYEQRYGQLSEIWSWLRGMVTAFGGVAYCVTCLVDICTHIYISVSRLWDILTTPNIYLQQHRFFLFPLRDIKLHHPGSSYEAGHLYGWPAWDIAESKSVIPAGTVRGKKASSVVIRVIRT
jgi:hypothetical protein